MESAKFLNPVLTLPIQHPAKEGLKRQAVRALLKKATASNSASSYRRIETRVGRPH